MYEGVFANGRRPARGPMRVVAAVRRLMVRALKPLYRRYVFVRNLPATMEDLHRRQDRVEAFKWDYVAFTRRLAKLEDHVEDLLRAREQSGHGGPPPGTAEAA
jgi:hypothetical protein